MLPSDLLLHRYRGETIEPKRLKIDSKNLETAAEIISIFESCVGLARSELDERLSILEGTETDYRVKRGLAHLLNSFAEFETRSPLEPEILRRVVFETSAKHPPGLGSSDAVLREVSERLSGDFEREVTVEEIRCGLYADLSENQIMASFEAPTPEALLHRYNLSQVQGVLYRASELVITAYRNEPSEYRQLFRYLKLFGLMTYIEGDAETGFTITIDGPASVLKSSTRYGTDIAKFLPSLLHVSRWKMEAKLVDRTAYDGTPLPGSFSLESGSGLVTHYKKGGGDGAVEEAFAKKWQGTKTDWRLERDVDLIPMQGSVMVPDFRIVHPEGAAYLLEIVGYWRPEYLKKKFAQVRRAGRDDLILAVSERLNLEGAGVKLEDIPAKVVWFKGKVMPNDVLALLPAAA